VDFHIEASGLTGSLDHRLEAAFRKWRPALTDKYERRFGPPALQPPKSSQFSPGQRMRPRTAILESTDVQERIIEINLIPPQIDQFRRA
jgi:hypothetical protein